MDQDHKSNSLPLGYRACTFQHSFSFLNKVKTMCIDDYINQGKMNRLYGGHSSVLSIIKNNTVTMQHHLVHWQIVFILQNVRLPVVIMMLFIYSFIM